ncbi:VanZ family protein [Massilia sp. BJB1822]|uniref:VanZ family protein n=1 Tax=Massilia sp. BJB1822 TaxID=2744470 RepID=UPI001592CA35|nr:VanZ family protein [Massilia sp. BJB1822]NVE01399.1 VanZ family protein [Massilia sp. BJB1822]
MAWEWMVFGLALAGVVAGCLLPARWLPLLPHDKLLHFLAFAGLTVLAARLAPDWAELRYWLLGLLVAGWLIEVLQKLVPGRSFCWRDLAANAAGIAVAASAILLLQAL